MLKTTFIQHQHSWRLQWSKEVDTTSLWLDELLKETMAHGATTLVIDLSATELIDSRGLAVLMDIYQKFSKNDVEITLKGPNERLRRLFRIMQFDRIFKIG